MPRRYRPKNRAYRPRNRNPVYRNRYTKRGAPQGGAGYRNREDARSPMRTLKLVLGRARVWVFNNSDRPVTIEPGQGLILQIVDEFGHRLGDAFRLTIIGPTGSEDAGDVEFKKSDWA
jgi:hypothetical protein